MFNKLIIEISVNLRICSCLACIHNSIYAQLKARANFFITERRQGSARRSLLLWYSAKFSQRTKKSKQTSWLAGQKLWHATFYTLLWARTFEPVNRQLWMKSSKFTGKMEKIRAKWTQVSLKNVLKVKDRNYLGVFFGFIFVACWIRT